MKRLVFFLLLLICACQRDKAAENFPQFETKKVIIVVIDGVRWSESWGDSTRANIPVRDSLLQYGVLITNFRNNGVTLTNPGHTAICTGNYDPIANDGTELPHFPGLLQTYVKYTRRNSSAWVTSSKDKLWVLAKTSYFGFDAYPVNIDCGVNGDGTGGYRPDSITYQHILEQLNTGSPEVMIVNFKDPDVKAHQGDSSGYIAAIQQTDEYIGGIVAFLNQHPAYQNRTTLIVTNDHGRHLPGIADGYISHGDGCDGCRHIEFFVLSPDFKQGVSLPVMREQIDISQTVAYLLHLPWMHGKGKVMHELFK